MTGGINLWLVIIFFVLPLTLGVALFVLATRFPRKWARIAARVVGSAFFLAFLAAVVVIGPYIWALHLESKWTAAKPTTKAQLESCLSLYSQRDIEPSQSGWGSDHALGPGERMTQYRLLYSAPLDVVYTSSNTIVAIYTSYE